MQGHDPLLGAFVVVTVRTGHVLLARVPKRRIGRFGGPRLRRETHQCGVRRLALIGCTSGKLVQRPLAQLAYEGTGDHTRLIAALAGQGQAKLTDLLSA